MAFCIHCGNKLQENAAFCASCGGKVEVAPVAPSANIFENGTAPPPTPAVEWLQQPEQPVQIPADVPPPPSFMPPPPSQAIAVQPGYIPPAFPQNQSGKSPLKVIGFVLLALVFGAVGFLGVHLLLPVIFN